MNDNVISDTYKDSQLTKRYWYNPAATCDVEGEKRGSCKAILWHIFLPSVDQTLSSIFTCSRLSNRAHTVNFQRNCDLPGKAIGTIAHPAIK